MNGQLYWRVEWHDGDVLTSPAMNTGWAGIDGADPSTSDGLSTCHSAAALLQYFEPFRRSVAKAEMVDFDPDDEECEGIIVPAGWTLRDACAALNAQANDILRRAHRCPNEDSRVVVLRGECIGAGQDGEPLIRPTQIVAETTYGALLDHPNVAWLDVLEADDLRRLISASETHPPRDAGRWLIHGLCVRMTREIASKWNAGNISDADLKVAHLYDADKDIYLSLHDAVATRMFGNRLVGAFAEEDDCRAIGRRKNAKGESETCMPQKPHPFAAKLREIRQPHEASLRKILDTADEVEARTGARPDVRRLYRERGGKLPLPDWFS